MLTVYSCEKDGVLALITKRDARDYGLVKKGNGCPFRAGVRIFTFADAEYLEQNPVFRRVYSGFKQFALVALKAIAGEYEIVENDPKVSGWDGDTPLFDVNKLTYPKEGGAPLWLRFCTDAEDMFVKFGDHP